MREENIIFNDLKSLCSSEGYAHVIAWFCWFGSGSRHEDIKAFCDQNLKLFSTEQLLRKEISLLIGLMYKKNSDITTTKLDIKQEIIDKTEIFLKEISKCLEASMPNSFLRELFFYNDESAYDFQYRDISQKKYEGDDQWLKENKGFFISDVKNVIHTIELIQTKKIRDLISNNISQEISILSPCIFSAAEIEKQSSIERTVIDKILQSFTPPQGERNQNFDSLNHFNITNAYPLIKLN